MKYKYFLVFCFIFLGSGSFGQETQSLVGKRTLLSIEAGGSFKGFFGARYIEPTSSGYNDPYSKHQYEGFTKMPAYGFGVGIRFAFSLSSHMRFTTGLSYYFRKTIYEKSQDEVITQNFKTDMNYIRNVFRYNYAYNNLEIPILLQYKIKKINIYGGINLSVLSYRVAAYNYMIYLYGESSYWNTSKKNVAVLETSFKLYPTLKVSYDVRINKKLIQPFFGIEIYEINLKEIYKNIFQVNSQISSNVPMVENCFFLQVGVIFPLKK